jgi:hypothetical protein
MPCACGKCGSERLHKLGEVVSKTLECERALVDAATHRQLLDAFAGLQLLLHISESSSQRRAAVLRGTLGRLCAVQLGVVAGQRRLLGRVRLARDRLFGLRELRRDAVAIRSGSVDVALHSFF